jgi:pimeloyl-ACP methyl ester carboxylesterase
MSIPQLSTTKRAPATFALGYHHIEPDVSLNYQMNRFSTGDDGMVGEVRRVAPEIRDYADYTREFLQLSERARDRGAAVKATGFDVITFDGPGQGAVLADEHLHMTPDWERPVGAILDFLHLEDVTLIGYSLGGCLALRATACEPRTRRVVCDHIFTDMVDASLRTGFSVCPPFEYFSQAKRYQTRDVSSLVDQDVLLLAGAEDHYIRLHQFHDQIRWLTGARSLTARLFMRRESAQNHMHVGNVDSRSR